MRDDQRYGTPHQPDEPVAHDPSPMGLLSTLPVPVAQWCRSQAEAQGVPVEAFIDHCFAHLFSGGTALDASQAQAITNHV